MTVLIYVDTSKQVGDPDHLKVFADEDAAETWLQERSFAYTRRTYYAALAAILAAIVSIIVTMLHL